MSDAMSSRSSLRARNRTARTRKWSDSWPQQSQNEATLAIAAVIASYKPPPTASPPGNGMEMDVITARAENEVLGKTDVGIHQSCQETVGQDNTISSPSIAKGVDLGPPKKPSFMDLPAEVRQMIFAHVLSPYKPEGYNSMIYSYNGENPRVLGRGHGQVCRLNRQCYNESIGLLYAQTLVFLNHETMTVFFQQRTTRQLAQIRSIRMLQRSTDWVPAIKYLVLPPEATLQVDWPIDTRLWAAMEENETLRYRELQLKNRPVMNYQAEGDDTNSARQREKWVLFKAVSSGTGLNSSTQIPSLSNLCYRNGNLRNMG